MDHRYRSFPFSIVQTIHSQKGHGLSEDEFLFGRDKLINLKFTVFFILPRNRDIFQKFESKSVENTVEPLGTDTSLIRTVSNIPTKFSSTFFKKKLYNTDAR